MKDLLGLAFLIATIATTACLFYAADDALRPSPPSMESMTASTGEGAPDFKPEH